MDSLAIFKQKLNDPYSQLIVSMKLPGMMYGVTQSGPWSEDKATIQYDTLTLCSGAESERFVGLVIDIETMRYNPLQKVPTGHRFFSFEGIKEVEITVNQFTPQNVESPDLKEAFTFQFEVDPHKYALVNACTTKLFTALSPSISVSWTRTHSRLLVLNRNCSVIMDRHCPIEKYDEIVSKLLKSRIQNFY